jgi:Ca2+-binding EF-hand superfamily protein
MCMSCVANCQRESPEFNLRPLGLDYGLPWLLPKSIQSPENMALSQVETNFWLGGIVCILQGSVLLHYLPKILTDIGMDPTIATVGPALDTSFFTHALLAFAVLGFPGGLSFVADAAAVPLESSVKVLQRQLTRTPAENAAIKTLYESMLRQNVELSAAIKEWDQDGDGTVSDWEIKEAFKLLDIPDYEWSLLFSLLGKEEGRTVSSLFDNIQELYFDVQEAHQGSISLLATYENQMLENEFVTKLTFLEIFNRLDKNGNGFISKDEFIAMSKEGYFKKPLSEEELNDLFDQADVLRTGRLNLFEFMSIMRKNVKVGIQGKCHLLRLYFYLFLRCTPTDNRLLYRDRIRVSSLGLGESNSILAWIRDARAGPDPSTCTINVQRVDFNGATRQYSSIRL